MTEIQAAIGRVQLRKPPQWLEQRRCNAAILTGSFRSIPALRVTEPPDYVGHAYHKYYAFMRRERLRESWTRDRIVATIVAEGGALLWRFVH